MATTANTTGVMPATRNVFLTPIASATGPASAIETGIRLTDTKKSSEATRPSRCAGTRRCSSVPQMTMGALNSTPSRKEHATRTQMEGAIPIRTMGTQPAPNIRFM